MKVIFHEDFYEVYTPDPAAATGRMEAVIEVIRPHVELVTAEPAPEQDIAAVHIKSHIESVKVRGLYPIAALAAGGASQAAALGLKEPAFGSSDLQATMPLLAPPGDSATLTIWPSPLSDSRETKKSRVPMCWILTSILEMVRSIS